MSAPGRAPGFTLFEVLGVILVTTLLLGVALNFYIDLSHQAARASEHTREVRRATAILDRVADDLEHALLVRKPAETDPLAHPWLFLAESTLSEGGSDRIKFVRRQTPRGDAAGVPDLGVVAYTLATSPAGAGFELRRWSLPGLPAGLDRAFPLEGDPASLRLTDGIHSFAVRFLDEIGEWRPTWDSSQLLESSELPLAVEIEVALVDLEAPEPGFGDEPQRYARQVQLPMRPIDLEILLEPPEDETGDGEDGEDDGEDRTIAECVDFAKIGAQDVAALGFSLSDLEALKQQAANASFSDYRSVFANFPAAVRPQCR